MTIPKQYRIKLRLCIFEIIIFIICVIFGVGYVYCGECLSSDDDMYNYILEFYKDAITGDASLKYGGIELHCWRGNEELNQKLKNTFEEMIEDPRLHPAYVTEVVNNYINMFGPTEFILNYFKISQGIVKEVIIKNLIYQKNTPIYDSVLFIKEQIVNEANIELRNQLIEALARKKEITYDDFIHFCQKNKILLEDKVIYNFKDIASLEYLYNIRSLENEQADYNDIVKMESYFRYSKYIHDVLANNLEHDFQVKYLERMSLEDLRYLRNGILASYGKTFKSKLLQYYYYGEYPYVNQYCRNRICGLGQRKKGDYKDSDLTAIDRSNLDNILKIEEYRKKIGYSESGLFIENYDIQAFLKNKSPRLTFSSPNIIDLKQVKLNWENNEIWLWDKNGISGWDLKREKRIHFIKNGKGPISFSKKHRLLSYQLNKKLIVENVDSGKIIYQEDLDKFNNRAFDNIYSIFSKDEEYFIFSSYKGGDGYLAYINYSIVQIDTGQISKIKLPHMYRYYYIDLSQELNPIPFIINKDNQYIIAAVSKGEDGYLAVIPLLPLENIRFESYVNCKMPNHVLSIAADSENENVYFSSYYNKSCLMRFNLNKILNKDISIIEPELIIDLKDSLFGYSIYLQLSDNLIFRGDGRNLVWINIDKVSQADLTQYNAEYSKKEKIDISKYKIANQNHIFTEFPIQSFDISEQHKMIAVGNTKGFVVISRYPNQNEIVKPISADMKKQTIGTQKDSTIAAINKKTMLTLYENESFDKIDFIDGPTKVFDKPTGQPINTLLDNSKVDILQQNGDWVEIKYANVKGWVLKDHLIGKDVNKIKAECYTVLSKAAFMGRLETVILLLKKGANININDKYGRNSLHWAIKGSFLQMNQDLIEIIRKLLKEKDIDINKTDNNGISPFLLAVQSQNIEIVKLLSIQKEIDANKMDEKGQTPLICAIKYGNNEIIKYLLSMPNIDANRIDQNSQTPIYYSIFNGNVEITKLLLTKNVKVDTVNSNGETLLHAIFKGYPYQPISFELLNLIIPLKEIDVNKEDINGKTPLLLAIEGKRLDAVEALLALKHIDVNQKTQSWNSYLDRVLCLSDLPTDYCHKVARLLLSRDDINVNIPGGSNGETPVHCSWYFGGSELYEIAKMIMTKNPDVNVVNKDGETPLFYNVKQKRTEIVKLLLTVKGIDLYRRDNVWHETPLGRAKSCKYTEIIELLIKAGATY